MEYTAQWPMYIPCEVFGADIEHQMVWRTAATRDILRMNHGDHCEICGFLVLTYHINRTVIALDRLDEYESREDGSIY